MDWIRKDIEYKGTIVGSIEFAFDKPNKVITINRLVVFSPKYVEPFLKELLSNANQAFFYAPERRLFDTLTILGFMPDEDGMEWEWTGFYDSGREI